MSTTDLREIAYRAYWLLEKDVQLAFANDLDRHAENALRQAKPSCDQWPRGQFLCERNAIRDRLFAEDLFERFPEETREAREDWSERRPRRFRGAPAPDLSVFAATTSALDRRTA